MKSSLESRFEHGLFAARWLMAPIYLGLVVALAMLLVVFVREIVYYALQVMTMGSEEVILAVLTLIDLSLAGNLLLIVLFSGYENFVSKFDIADGRERPSWMGTVDFSGLKMKLVASIVAISAISLLKSFMEVGEYRGRHADRRTQTALDGHHPPDLRAFRRPSRADGLGFRKDRPTLSSRA